MLLLALLAVSHTAMTYNVLYEGGDDAKTIAVIARESPDLVCLQEVTPRFARRVQKELAYPHVVVEARNGTWGVAVLSKLPIKRHQVFAQAPHKMPAIEADVEVAGQRLRIACVHLFPPGAKRFASDDLPTTLQKNAELRVQQARALAKRFSKGPALLLGDFNEGRDDAATRVLLDAGWSHSCLADDARCGGTWPGATSPMPAVFAIDQILGRGLSFRGTRVIKDGGSDHYPVVTTFAL